MFETFSQLEVFLAIIALLVIGFLVSSHTAVGKIKQVLGSFKLGNTNGTPTLNTYTIDFTLLATAHKIDPVVGRDKEIIRLAQILSRKGKNNAMLIGAPGVGKTAIVEGLAARIISKEVPETLQGKRLLSLNVASLLSGTKYRGEFEERAKRLVEEIARSERSIILFIDEVHSIIQSQGTEGSVNLSDMLKPALARGDLQMIGATTIDEYKKYIQSEPSLERRFQPIMVEQPNVKETLAILQGVKDVYEKHHMVTFTDAALETAAKKTNKLTLRSLPDKAIDALDEAGSLVRVSHVHEAIPLVLYEAAKAKRPDIETIWQSIQALDTMQAKKRSATTQTKREALEKKLAETGMLIVDADDVQTVIDTWIQDM